jgi:DNA-binding beta-propeller fold protein YncE
MKIFRQCALAAILTLCGLPVLSPSARLAHPSASSKAGSVSRTRFLEAPPTFQFEFGPDGSGPGQLHDPRGITTDAQGRVFIADTGNHRIQVHDAEGRFLYGWGREGGVGGSFNGCVDLALDEVGNVYVADMWNSRIQVFTEGGQLLRIFAAEQYGFGLLSSIDVKFGQIFVLDVIRNRFSIMDLYGQHPKHVPAPYPDARALAVDEESNIYVLSSKEARVTKYNSQGYLLFEWGNPGDGPGQFASPLDIDTDVNGYVYVADRNNFRVQKFDGDGRFVTMWGSHGTDPGQFLYLSSLAAGSAGRIYVTQGTDVLPDFAVQVFAPPVRIEPAHWGAIKMKYR